MHMKKRKAIALGTLVAAIAVALFVFIKFYFVFGEGVKAGELNFVVYKGYIFKTYEGKVIQAGFNSKSKNTSSAIQSYEFEFSITDPAVADFHDTKTVKVVSLDDVCRMQQVHDGCFPAFDDVPQHAMTVTIPELVSARKVFCIVPTDKKAEAVRNALEGPVAETCPSSETEPFTLSVSSAAPGTEL